MPYRRMIEELRRANCELSCMLTHRSGPFTTSEVQSVVVGALSEQTLDQLRQNRDLGPQVRKLI